MARFSKRRKGIFMIFVTCISFMFIVMWLSKSSDKNQNSDIHIDPNDAIPDDYVSDNSERHFDSDFSVITGVNLSNKMEKLKDEYDDNLEAMSNVLPNKPLPGFILRKKILKESLFGTKDPSKYLFIIGHYEQLGKTTINFINAGAFAASTGRKLVAPYVRDSRFTGIPGGWFGNVRVGTRAFYSWDNYFDVASFQKMFRDNNLSPIVSLDQLRRDCSVSTGEELTLVYFMYEKDEQATRKYLSLTDQNFHRLLNNTQTHRWVECRVLNKVLQLHKRIGNVSIGRQLCVDAEKIRNMKEFEDDVLKRDKCVAFVYWKGVGPMRTHFDVPLFGQEARLLKDLQPSHTILSEVERFINKHLTNKFIGVHIRSERLLRFNSLKTFSRCLSTAQEFLSKYTAKYPLAFVSDDVTLHGSDTIGPAVNQSYVDITTSSIQRMVKKFNAKIYHVKKAKHPYWTDTGVVALIQMHILARAQHLITVGDGNFQEWVVNTFRKQKELLSDKRWRIVRCCATETEAPTQQPLHLQETLLHTEIISSIQS